VLKAVAVDAAPLKFDLFLPLFLPAPAVDASVKSVLNALRPSPPPPPPSEGTNPGGGALDPEPVNARALTLVPNPSPNDGSWSDGERGSRKSSKLDAVALLLLLVLLLLLLLLTVSSGGGQVPVKPFWEESAVCEDVDGDGDGERDDAAVEDVVDDAFGWKSGADACRRSSPGAVGHPPMLFDGALADNRAAATVVVVAVVDVADRDGLFRPKPGGAPPPLLLLLLLLLSGLATALLVCCCCCCCCCC